MKYYTHKPTKLTELTIQTVNFKRFYETPDGKLYPSITTVLSTRNKKGLFETQNNRIYFVIMHELGHIITDEVGHTPKFWRNFKKILKTAIKHKLYKYRDYYIDPVEFCNIIINSTPLKI